MEYLKEHKKTALKGLSVDVNRCVNAPGYIIDNTLKGADAAILNSVDVIKNGAEASFTAVGLKEGGMGLMALKPDMLEQKPMFDCRTDRSIRRSKKGC